VSEVERLVREMREQGQAMKGGPTKGTLLKWSLLLENALEADRAVSEPEPPAPLHGCFDVVATGYREVWGDGVLQHRYPRDRCPGNRPWGRFPDVPRRVE
jgi:hypothetical protein